MTISAPRQYFRGFTRKVGLASIRLVPVHPVLQEIGFMHYCNARKAKGQESLFSIQFKKDNRPNYGFSVQKYIRRHVTTDTKKTFHSFRHSFADRLKQARVQPEVISELLGHSISSISMNRYGKKFQPKTLLAEIQKVAYPISSLQIEDLKKIPESRENEFV